MLSCHRVARLAILVLCVGPAGHADPMGSVEAGGTVRVEGEHPSISLDRELLIFEPQARRVLVTAELEFRNHGDATDVPMVFPVPMFHPGSGQDLVQSFAVEVDGQALETSKDRCRLLLAERELGCRAYRFTVPFDAGHRRRMVVRYAQSAISPQVMYVLATGGTWRGAIRDFRLEVRLGERLDYHDLSLTGDGEPLSYREDEATLTWTCRDYQGKPEVLRFLANRGPARVTIEGEVGLRYKSRYLRRRQGRLLADPRFLGDLLMAGVKNDREDSAEVTKEGRTVALDRYFLLIDWLPDGREVKSWFVDPAPALAAFGGAIVDQRDEAGDAVVSIRALPDSAASARRTALFQEQTRAYRLRSLRALAARWPAALDEVARELCTREQDEPVVVLAALGYLADRQPDEVDPAAVERRLAFADTEDRLDKLLALALSSSDETVLRGVLGILAGKDPAAVLEHLIGLTVPQSGTTQGRSAGLILRALRPPGAAAALTTAIREAGVGESVEAGLIALGLLGDDEAVGFLMPLVRGETALYGRARTAAADGLALVGSRLALETCADLALAYQHDRNLRWRLQVGFERAVGTVESARRRTVDRPLPAWAPGWSRSEATRVALPLLERLVAELTPGRFRNRFVLLRDQAREEVASRGLLVVAE